jgi:hypothetical protein
VDTGAAFCIFQREFAEQLGLDVEGGQLQVVATAAGQFDAYGHALTLCCFDWEFEAMVCFAAPPDFRRSAVPDGSNISAWVSSITTRFCS